MWMYRAYSVSDACTSRENRRYIQTLAPTELKHLKLNKICSLIRISISEAHASRHQSTAILCSRQDKKTVTETCILMDSVAEEAHRQ